MLPEGPDIAKEARARNNLTSHHRMVSSEVGLNLCRERKKIQIKQHLNITVLKQKAEEYSLKIQNISLRRG